MKVDSNQFVNFNSIYNLGSQIFDALPKHIISLFVKPCHTNLMLERSMFSKAFIELWPTSL